MPSVARHARAATALTYAAVLGALLALVLSYSARAVLRLSVRGNWGSFSRRSA